MIWSFHSCGGIAYGPNSGSGQAVKHFGFQSSFPIILIAIGYWTQFEMESLKLTAFKSHRLLKTIIMQTSDHDLNWDQLEQRDEEMRKQHSRSLVIMQKCLTAFQLRYHI